MVLIREKRIADMYIHKT